MEFPPSCEPSERFPGFLEVYGPKRTPAVVGLSVLKTSQSLRPLVMLNFPGKKLTRERSDSHVLGGAEGKKFTCETHQKAVGHFLEKGAENINTEIKNK